MISHDEETHRYAGTIYEATLELRLTRAKGLVAFARTIEHTIYEKWVVYNIIKSSSNHKKKFDGWKK